MKLSDGEFYVSIDIETTGLNHDECEVIQFGAVVDDLLTPLQDLPRFETLVLSKDGVYMGEPFALSMHGEIWKSIAKIQDALNAKLPTFDMPHWCYAEDLGGRFIDWLHGHGWNPRHHITVAGKNYAMFDHPFLLDVPGFAEAVTDNKGRSLIRHRVIDPGNLYWDFPKDRFKLPDSKTCLQRAGMDGHVAHTALDDALMVVKLVRNKLLPQIGLRQDVACPSQHLDFKTLMGSYYAGERSLDDDLES